MPISVAMLVLRLFLLFVLGTSSQSIDLGGLLSAEQSVQSTLTGLAANAGGAVASLAQSGLSQVNPASSPVTSAPSSNGSPASSTSASEDSSSLPTSAAATRSEQTSRSSSPTSTLDASLSSSNTPSSRMITSSTSRSDQTSSSSPATRQLAASTSPTPAPAAESEDDNDDDKNHLLEIILPTVLSGLTLLAILGLIAWICARRRSRKRHRRSGLSRIYAAGSPDRSGYSSPAMEERDEQADHGLLPTASTPPPIPPISSQRSRDAGFGTPRASVAPGYSAQDHPSRPASLYPQAAPTGLPLHTSTSNSTNGASVIAASHGSLASNRGHFYNKTPHQSYQPVTSDEPPVELAAEHGNVNDRLPHSYSQQVPPTRARTPPLQAMFPWFGPKSDARQTYQSPRMNGGLHGTETSLEGPNDFDFAFDNRSTRTSTKSQTPKTGRSWSFRSNRFAIPRKPVPL
ncbi:MAG: hypothetical protein Q9159_005113 [Coniocarpon cinnabarinum]